MEEDILAQLGVNWKLLSAQLVNFGLLLFILYKFLYKPILQMLKKRAETIARSMEEARQIEESRKQTKEARQKMLKRAKEETSKMLAEAKHLGAEERQDLLKKAGKEAEELVNETKKSLLREKEGLAISLSKEMGSLVALALRNIFSKRTVSAEEQEELVKEGINSLGKI